MESLAKYLVVSLPQSEDAQSWLEESLNGGKIPVHKFALPDFQIGTLDSLIQQSDELSKLDQQLASSVGKVVDILNTITDQSFTRVVNNRNVLDYTEAFAWNTSKYRLDKHISQLVQVISSEALTLDNDVRSAYQQYQTAKSNFLAADRKKNGDLSIKSLHEIVKPEQFVLDSEHLTTVLIAVPKNLIGDFELSYETVTQFVIPRSAAVIATDPEFSLYTVTLFKKFQLDFINAAREHKWHPRTDFTYSEETLNNLRKEFDLTRATESKTKNDVLRLAKTAYLEIYASWFHIKAIRIYVESVLRYGLPPQFDAFLLRFTDANLKAIDKARKELVDKYGYLGGDSFSNKSSLHEYASLVDTEYEPFVLYEAEVV